MNSKVKVSTDKLLDAVKVRRTTLRREYERALAKYEKDCEAYSGKVCDALRKALASAEAGRLPAHDTHYRGQHLQVLVRFTKPCRPSLNTSQVDRLIATLEMASEPTLTISADDAAQYLG